MRLVTPARTKLQPLSSGVARVEVMPELDVVLVLFPAEKNFPAADDGGKIHQSAVDVLDLNFALLKFIHQPPKIRDGPGPAVDQIAAGVASRFHERTQALVIFQQMIPRLLQL